MKRSITKNDISKDLRLKHPYMTQRDSVAMTNDFFDTITDCLKEGRNLYIRGFATIKIVTRKPKKGRNILENTEIDIPEKKVLKIIASDEILDVLNKNKSVYSPT